MPGFLNSTWAWEIHPFCVVVNHSFLWLYRVLLRKYSIVHSIVDGLFLLGPGSAHLPLVDTAQVFQSGCATLSANQKHWHFQLSHILHKTRSVCLFGLVILVSVRWIAVWFKFAFPWLLGKLKTSLSFGFFFSLMWRFVLKYLRPSTYLKHH